MQAANFSSFSVAVFFHQVEYMSPVGIAASTLISRIELLVATGMRARHKTAVRQDHFRETPWGQGPGTKPLTGGQGLNRKNSMHRWSFIYDSGGTRNH